MRPHRLSLQAFGAFPGRVELDFDALGAGGLVLLCGDTGSGKTTILDALGFALFGRVPGERDKARDLRSHHAAEGVPPEVVLEFSARGRRWRVTRSPAWSRPGRASEIPAKGLLEELSGDATVRTWQRLDDIGDQIKPLVGMKFDQFFQVVLLPQGRFAAFLQADHDKREELLKQLFHVDRFEFVERWLRDRALGAARGESAAQAALDQLVARVGQVEGVDLADGEDPEAWATRLQAGAAAARAMADARVAALAAARSAAEAEAAAAQELAGRQARRREALARRGELELRQPAVEALRDALTAARRAAPVVAAVTELRSAERAWEVAVGALTAARAVLPAGCADGTVVELAAAGAAAQRDLGGLDHLRALDGESRAAAASAAVAGERLAEAERRRAGLEGELSGALAVAVTEAGMGLAAADAAREALPGLQAADAEDTEVIALAGEVTAAAADLEALEAARAAAGETVSVAVAEELDLRVRRTDAAAAELATYLVDGTPCPVCGGLEHPEPFESGADEVARDDERAAAARLAAARTIEQGLVGQAAAAAERLRSARQRLAGRVAPEPGALAARRRTLRAVAATAGAAAAARAALDAARVAVAAAGQELALAAAACAEQAARRAEAGARAAAAGSRLAEALGAESLAQRTARLSGTVAAVESALFAATVEETAARIVTSASSGVERLLASQEFGDIAAALAADRDPGRLVADDAALRSHDEELAAVRARLADPDLAVDVDLAVDLPGCRQAVDDAVKVHAAAADEAALLRDRLRQLAELQPLLAAAAAALVPLAARAAELRALAEVAAGRAGNSAGMPLATFVLAARLEEVALAASARLGRMTGGRYTLVHSDAARDRRHRAGLALLVEDSWTGRSRDTATLSGGETFMTALALALGLADVVTAEAGGSSIEALFVDEGFGSLDPDSLDHVMTVLDDLRSGGRLVGLVSHVAELRLRVPSQVHVLKGRAGSDIAVAGT